MTFTYSRGQKSLSGITPGYHMSMHAKNHVPRPSRLAVIEKCHVCDGQTNRQTDKQTDRQTENRHELFLSLTFIDMTHNNILILRHLVKIFHTDRQRKFIIWWYIHIYIYVYIYIYHIINLRNTKSLFGICVQKLRYVSYGWRSKIKIW